MSTSTDGQLCYGIELEDCGELPWEDYDFEDWYAQEILKIDTSEMEYEERSKIYDSIKIDCLFHCCYDEPMHILYIKGTELTASRGCPEHVDMADLSKAITSESIVDLIKIADMVYPEHEPAAWILSSMWG